MTFGKIQSKVNQKASITALSADPVTGAVNKAKRIAASYSKEEKKHG